MSLSNEEILKAVHSDEWLQTMVKKQCFGFSNFSSSWDYEKTLGYSSLIKRG